MAVLETRLHVCGSTVPRVRVHKDGRRADLSTSGGPGSAFTLTGSPDAIRAWLEVALHHFEEAEARRG